MTHVGEEFVNKKGCRFKIVVFNKRSDVIVEFLDEHKARVHTQYGNCLKGAVKNPFYPSVYNVGYLGVMSNGEKPVTKIKGKMTREYNVWVNMLQRVYSKTWLEKHPTYKNITVCERWLCYSNFLEDLPYIVGYEYWRSNPNKRIGLDKDFSGKNIYSLETTCFVDVDINADEAVRRHKTRKQVYGVNITTGKRTEIFNSINHAARSLGINRTGITQCINGQLQTYKDYYWYELE